MLAIMRRPSLAGRLRRWDTRHYHVLALESSCDDSCVALLAKRPGSMPEVVDQAKLTLDSTSAGGIIPTKAHEFHQASLAPLVAEFIARNQLLVHPPDIIACTRGPGMVGSLAAGLQLAKGLATAWNKPLIGVHHMLGHIFIAKLASSPQFPFLSLLCSGGHTMLVLAEDVHRHEVLVDTMDIAVGDALDKCARELGFKGNVLGRELEKYVDQIDPGLKKEFGDIDTSNRDNEFNFVARLPLVGPKQPVIPTSVKFSFASFLSSIQNYKRDYTLNSLSKPFIAYKTQDMIFNHTINRVNTALKKYGIASSKGGLGDGKLEGVQDFVFSGGVACNKVFREKLEQNINSELLSGTQQPLHFHFPDPSLCTDNAVMIGMAGIEIFENLKYVSDMTIQPIRKWPMNELLSPEGWVKVDDAYVNKIMNLYEPV